MASFKPSGSSIRAAAGASSVTSYAAASSYCSPSYDRLPSY